MADSSVVTVTVGGPTEFYGFYESPSSGGAPLAIRVSGWLRITGGDPKDPATNGELIRLQDLIGGVWTTIATFTTVSDSDGNTGAFVIFATLTTPGTHQIRVHYDGNAAKGLEGCEQDTATAEVTGEVPQFPWALVIVGGVIWVTLAIALQD